MFWNNKMLRSSTKCIFLQSENIHYPTLASALQARYCTLHKICDTDNWAQDTCKTVIVSVI